MIPEEAVEAAVKNWYDHQMFSAETAMRIALEAAAPVLMAQAWDELCAKMSDDLTDAAPGYGEDMRRANPCRKSLNE